MTAATSAATTVRDFLQHLAARETDAALALLADDVVWRNTGMPSFEGERVHAMLRDMEKRGVRFDVRFKHVATDGDVVLTDRTDVIGMGGWETSFGVRGTFEVREGRIAVWDDAFSWLELLGSGVVGIGRLLAGR
ncbi:limonene-1,2-epoxide hydrolase family protein [Nocardioides sp.]|uniref:limonene-1,2-epoxide hydrolase family protein n=1 Tax=Nocardioides sp. TaxID=35761 RepID=UPI003782F86F